MALLTRDELKTLIEAEAEVCGSLYMPTVRAGRETRQNPIRFRNLLGEVEEGLVQKGYRSPEIDEMLRPARDLAANDFFWQYQADGLACFITPEQFRFYRLPMTLDVLATVDERFHVKPLLPYLTGDGRFYILSLSPKAVRFYEASRFAVSEVYVPDMPMNMKTALWMDDEEREMQWHTGTQNVRGDRRAMYWGIGTETHEPNSALKRYFRQINDALQPLLEAERTPLVLAATEPDIPRFLEVSSYEGLLEEAVTANPDLMGAEELHEHAWPIVEPVFKQAEEESRGTYAQLSKTDRASADVREIVHAAHVAQVSDVWVAVDQQRWGTYDEEKGVVRLHEEKQPGDADLLDDIAVQTIIHGGTAYAVESDRVPDAGPAAAWFRFTA